MLKMAEPLDIVTISKRVNCLSAYKNRTAQTKAKIILAIYLHWQTLMRYICGWASLTRPAPIELPQARKRARVDG